MTHEPLQGVPAFHVREDGKVALQILVDGKPVVAVVMEPQRTALYARMSLEAALQAGGGEELDGAPPSDANPVFVIRPSEGDYVVDGDGDVSLVFRFGRARIGFLMTPDELRALGEFAMTLSAQGRRQ